MSRNAILGSGAAAAVLMLTAGCSSGSSASAPDPQEESGPYDFFLSNNYAGNDWRVQMQETAKVAADKEPFAGKVNMRVVTSQNTVESQISDINNMISQGADAILIDAASPTALNSAIERACDKGIVVVSFDQIVEADCAWKVQSDWELLPRVVATWLAESLGGEGEVVLDRGLAGSPLAELMTKGYEETLAKYPGIEIAGSFNGDYDYGPERQGVADLLAAHPNVVGATTDNWGSSALQAFIDAGKDRASVTGYGPNGALVQCAEAHAENPDFKCFHGSNGPSLSAEAMKVALEVLEGERANEPGVVLVSSPFYTTDVLELPGFEDLDIQEIEIGTNAFPDLPPSLGLPWSPTWMDISPEEVAVKQ